MASMREPHVSATACLGREVPGRVPRERPRTSVRRLQTVWTSQATSTSAGILTPELMDEAVQLLEQVLERGRAGALGSLAVRVRNER